MVIMRHNGRRSLRCGRALCERSMGRWLRHSRYATLLPRIHKCRLRVRLTLVRLTLWCRRNAGFAVSDILWGRARILYGVAMEQVELLIILRSEPALLEVIGLATPPLGYGGVLSAELLTGLPISENTCVSGGLGLRGRLWIERRRSRNDRFSG